MDARAQPSTHGQADDPGAGKTIMTGLFIRELIVRDDLRRCLIMTPGSLVEQWQPELAEKFHLDFALMTRDRIDGSARGNPFNDTDLLIARLDKLSRDEDLQDLLENAHDWDLVVFDEAPLNGPDRWYLAIVEVNNAAPTRPICLRRPFAVGPDPAATSVNYSIKELLAHGELVDVWT